MPIGQTLKRRTSPDDMIGLTVRKTIEHPGGKWGNSLGLVILFTDESWAGLSAEVDGFGEDCRAFLEFQGLPSEQIANFLSPEQLLDAGLIDASQMELLLVRQQQEVVACAEQTISSLRSQIANLEAQIQQISPLHPKEV